MSVHELPEHDTEGLLIRLKYAPLIPFYFYIQLQLILHQFHLIPIQIHLNSTQVILFLIPRNSQSIQSSNFSKFLWISLIPLKSQLHSIPLNSSQFYSNPLNSTQFLLNPLISSQLYSILLYLSQFHSIPLKATQFLSILLKCVPYNLLRKDSLIQPIGYTDLQACLRTLGQKFLCDGFSYKNFMKFWFSNILIKEKRLKIKQMNIVYKRFGVV